MSQELPISADLLEILRDPLAVQEPDKYGPDPGRLELVHNCWLVSKDTGLKYPISEGIPVMLIDEGMKWKDTPVDDLPVPPPPIIPKAPPAPAPSSTELTTSSSSAMNMVIYGAAGIAVVTIVIFLWYYLTSKRHA